MSYVDRVLEPDERVLYSTQLHWRSHVPAIIFFMLALGCAAVGITADAYKQQPIMVAAAALLAMAVAIWIPAAIRRSSSQFVVTDRRVIVKRGVFSRHTIEMNRNKVESVDVDQTLLGRVLDYGTVIVRGTGGGLEPIQNIAHPMRFRTHITVGGASGQNME